MSNFQIIQDETGEFRILDTETGDISFEGWDTAQAAEDAAIEAASV